MDKKHKLRKIDPVTSHNVSMALREALRAQKAARLMGAALRLCMRLQKRLPRYWPRSGLGLDVLEIIPVRIRAQVRLWRSWLRRPMSALFFLGGPGGGAEISLESHDPRALNLKNIVCCEACGAASSHSGSGDRCRYVGAGARPEASTIATTSAQVGLHATNSSTVPKSSTCAVVAASSATCRTNPSVAKNVSNCLVGLSL